MLFVAYFYKKVNGKRLMYIYDPINAPCKNPYITSDTIKIGYKIARKAQNNVKPYVSLRINLRMLMINKHIPITSDANGKKVITKESIGI